MPAPSLRFETPSPLRETTNLTLGGSNALISPDAMLYLALPDASEPNTPLTPSTDMPEPSRSSRYLSCHATRPLTSKPAIRGCLIRRLGLATAITMQRDMRLTNYSITTGIENDAQASRTRDCGVPAGRSRAVDRSTGLLSAREREVLQLVVQGCLNKEIAAELFISVNTVKRHLKTLFAKLNSQNRTECAIRAVQQGIIRFE